MGLPPGAGPEAKEGVWGEVQAGGWMGPGSETLAVGWGLGRRSR